MFQFIFFTEMCFIIICTFDINCIKGEVEQKRWYSFSFETHTLIMLPKTGQ